jgi:hypothetical protein|tara:strand:+ start:192 stop:653 length:462 start_codon:yes stop_codon:yes gene_type:complete
MINNSKKYTGDEMKVIKESKTLEEYAEDIDEQAHAQGRESSYDVIEQMEKEWPEMTKEFKKIQKEQYELFLHKQHDYGPGNISVGTQLQTPEEVHLSLTGLWFRMNDKIQRLKNLLMSGKQNAVEGETIVDAYLDVSNYGIMATIVKNGKWGK